MSKLGIHVYIDEAEKIYPYTLFSSSDLLQMKVNSIIVNYWYNDKNWDYWAARQKSKNKKDIFKSKSTPHMFPWYHRNRRY
ncbi:gp28 [Escherichia phage N4]|uniref:Gp28 n=3 Tax=Enquatrovirus N4 TaxID=10752 RepID=A0MZB8_BPN4|nr:gp28 [Escherichia phage N4]AYR04212.1 hypothetical protein [Escherichia phage OLB145]QPN96295.1 hypothetical protein vec25_29 [Escherichia phage VEc25]QXV75819.1 hypothetical protein bas69_0051 [Escherichia phage AlfredRasser]CAE6410867.1 gp28 [Escherichia phage vB_Eco_Jura]CAH0462272.1 gp28 [Escherichia phage N4] [Escherichia phage vB_Eco_SPSP]CAH6421920.1 Hypothetical protein AL25TRB_062 [Escherichia phage vB_Eco_AL25]